MSDNERRATVERYSSGERTNHWLIALGFVLAALSGLALFHPALFWLSNLFGGGPWTRILHPFVGLFMLIVFVPLAASVWGDNRMQAADWQWLRQLQDVVHNREERLPEVGRYNADRSSCSSPSPPACSGCCCPASSSGAPISRSISQSA